MTVDWENGPKGHFMHSSCYINMCSSKHLMQAQKRKQKSANQDEQPPTSEPAIKKLRSSMGVLHDKSLCVWCMKGAARFGSRENSKLLLLATQDAWNKFKVHTVLIPDDTIRDRLNTLIASIPDSQTAFGLEIRYHRNCWRKYVSYSLSKTSFDEHADHLQHVNLREAQAIFFFSMSVR